jgi:peptidoglycan-associated lipoprotein
MKKTVFASLFIAIAVLAGCASQETKEQPPAAVVERQPGVAEQKPAPKLPAEPAVKPLTEAPVTEQALGAAALKDPKNILSKRSVFFDFDSSSVKEEFRPLITAHARYLQQNRSTHITIQGNTDERGSREYNIALGQRRADSVKKMMLLLGAGEQQIETVSFGEEKPRAQGSSEEAYAQNRRADIVYPGE